MESTLIWWLVIGMVVLFAFNIGIDQYLKYRERKSARNLKRLLRQAQLKLGKDNFYGRR